MKYLFLPLFLIAISVPGLAQYKLADAPVFQSAYIEPKTVIKKAPGHYFIDFGKDAFGNLSLVLKATQTDSLVVHVGEKLSGPNTIDRKPGGTIRYQRLVLSNLPLNKPYTVVFAKDRANDRPPAVVLPDSFGRVLPFRYVEIENLIVPVKDLLVKQKVFNYRFNDAASDFSSSDTVLNQIWDLCKHTIKATSFTGLYIDGDRERIPYEADAYINQLSHYAVDNEYTLARRTNEYFITHPTWPTEWILHTALLFYNDYLYTGNTSALAKHYEALKPKTLTALEREDGLINANSSLVSDELMKSIGFENTGRKIEAIVDWPLAERDGYEMVNVNTVVNAFHYISLKRMADIAGVLNKKEDSLFFHQKSVLVKNAINQKLLDKAKGIYVDGEGSAHSSLHANMFPLAFGIVPEENRGQVISFIKSRGMACSVYGAQYLLEALYQHGEAGYAYQLMSTQEGDRNWWNMIRQGSTMAWEAWDIKYKPNQDWNHAWGTAPANIITRYMWGIAPATPGFDKVTITPQLSSLTWSKIKVPTIKGAIQAAYKQVDKQHQTFVIELPKGIQGAFVLPAGSKGKVFLNKKAITPKNNRFSLSAGRNQIELREK